MKQNKQDFLKTCTMERIKNGAASTEAFAACSLAWDRMTAQDLSAAERRVDLSTAIDLTPVAGDKPAARRFLIDAYTGQPIDTPFGGKLFIDIAGIDANAKIPILREHVRDRPVGFGTPFSDENRFFVDGQFSEYSADAKEVISLADEGYPWEASVGIWAKAVRQLKTDEKITVNGAEITGPATVWTQSKVREVSFVALGADENTAAIVMNDSAGMDPVEYKQADHQEEPMEITMETLTADAPELLASIIDEAVQAERARILEIIDADGDQDVTLAAIQAGTAPSAVYKQLYQAEKARKAHALQEMAAEAPPSMGAEVPPDPDPVLPADQQLAKQARELADSQNMDIAAATRLILQQDMDLARRYAANLIH